MDPVERLAAYLADELTPEHRRELELELRRDPQLDAQLTSMRRADAALAGLPRAQPPAGFEDRLAAVVDATLAPLREDDQLAAARARRTAARGLPAWAAIAGTAAAGLVLVVGAVTVLTPGGDADEAVVALSGADEAQLLADEPPDALPSEPGGDAVTAEDADETQALLDPVLPSEGEVATAGDTPTPVVVATARTVEPELLEAVAGDPVLTDLADQRYDRLEGQQVAADHAAAVGVDRGIGPRSNAEGGPVGLAGLDVLDLGQLDLLSGCIDAVLGDTDPPPVVGYLEVAVGDTDTVMVIGLVTFDDLAGRYRAIVVTPRRLPGCEPLLADQLG